MNKNILTATLTLVLIACCYFGVFHSHRYFGFDLRLCVVICGLLCIIALDFLYFGLKSKWQKFRTFMVVLFFGGPIAVVVILLHEHYITRQLSEHGTHTHGLVSRLYDKKHKHKRFYYAEFKYSVVGKTWTQTVGNDDHKISLGDTLELRCSTEDPEAFEILEDVY